MLKVKDLMLVVLFVVIVIGSIYHGLKVKGLEKQIAKINGVDTVEVVIQIRDTVFVEQADVFVDRVDTVQTDSGIEINHWPYLEDNVSQPLFDLRVQVDSKKAEFRYDFKYRPIKLQMVFADKYDLRKGFQAKLDPDIGTVNVDWGDYKPLKKKIGLSGALGLGYDRAGGVFLLGELSLKKFSIGSVWGEGGQGFYLKRTLFSF